MAKERAGPLEGKPAPSARVDRGQVIKSLEDQLTRTPRGEAPYDHARLAYRLGMAYAESAGTSPEMLRKALACYDTAAAIFDPRLDPVEHGRVLNAAGIAHRALGGQPKAVELYQKAVELFDGHDRGQELAAILNNLGLAQAELGHLDEAVEAFDRAVDLFDTDEADGRRGRAATLYNRGQAHQAKNTPEALEAALADYGEALSTIDMEEAPLHYGSLQNAMGAVCFALAATSDEDRDRMLQEAAHAFDESLVVFNRNDFPFQFALAKHNLGLAHTRLGGTANLRRAIGAFEDTLAMLDTRVHADFRAQAYANLQAAEKALEESFPGMTRTEHFAHLVAGCKEGERRSLMRERIHYVLSIPEPRRSSAMAEVALAIAKLPYEKALRLMTDELEIVIEMPIEKQHVAYSARYAAHCELTDEEVRLTADKALDQAIGDALGGPQRVYVRDYFTSLGWERP